MDDIAEQAGVSKPVLYQHFPGKLDLYLALLEDSCLSLIAAIDTALNSTQVNHDRVRAIIAAYFAFVDDPDGASRLVFESDLTQERAVRSLIDDANSRCAVLVGEVIADETGLEASQALLLGFSLIGLAQTSARAWLADGPTIPREQAQALAAHYERLRSDGASESQLGKLLASLAELIPWLLQWHNEIDPVYGERMGDFFKTFVEEESRRLHLTAEDRRRIATSRG